MNIALVGFMGAGKTTVSRALSERLGLEEVDTDRWIVEQEGRSIAEIFETEGEEGFRRIESDAVRTLALGGQQASAPDRTDSRADGKILSCGGGVVLRSCNVEALKQNGVIVLLTAEPKTIFERVRHGKSRPILNGNMNIPYITSLMEKRRPAYEAAADLVIATDRKSPAKIAEEIAEKVAETFAEKFAPETV